MWLGHRASLARASAKRGPSDPARQCAIGGRAGAGSDLITPEFQDAPRIVLISVLFQDKLRSVCHQLPRGQPLLPSITDLRARLTDAFTTLADGPSSARELS